MSERNKEQLIEHIRELIADMPQPDPFRRTAAFFGVVVEATEIPEGRGHHGVDGAGPRRAYHPAGSRCDAVR